jgi:APA family basic amino acid/polyamine antiporter
VNIFSAILLTSNPGQTIKRGKNQTAYPLNQRMNLFRRKNVADLQAEVRTDQSLKRALGPFNLTTLGIGAIIGAGIFVLTGRAAAQYAGPAIVLSFILAGVACAFAGLC